MPKIKRDEKQKDIYYFEETENEKEIRLLKEALAELQEREKQRDKTFKPKYDFVKA